MKKILVATDGSAGAQTGVAWAARFIAAIGAKAVVATVAESGLESFGPIEGSPTGPSEAADLLEREWAAPFDDAGLDRELRVLEGDVRGAIMSAVTEGDIDAVVIGTRGTGGFHGLSVGSAAHYLARHLPCPLIAVPAAAGPLTGGTIVAGADGSAANEPAIRWAAGLAGPLGAHLVALFAYSPLSDVMTHPAANWHYPWEAKLRAELGRVAAESGTDLEIVTAPGHPVEELLGLAAARDAGLLVVGRRGLGSVHGLLLGRVPAQLLHHATRPVAIVPH